MGAGASSLGTDQQDKIAALSIQAKRKFKLYEEEISMLNLSVEETEQLLSEKYKELQFAERKPKSIVRSGKQQKPLSNTTSESELSLPNVQAGKKDHQHPTSTKARISKRGSLPRISTSNAPLRDLLEKKTSSKFTLSSEGSLPSVKKELSRDRKELSILDCDAQSIDLAEVDVNNDALTEVTPSLRISPKKEFVCKLCKKQFRSQAMLSTHLSYSQLHRQALLDLHQKYKAVYDDVDRLDRMAKEVIDHLHHLLEKHKEKARLSATGMELRVRWQQAIQKVISQCTSHRFSRLLSQLKPPNSDPTLVPEPSLLGREYKFFWRQRLHIVCYLYSHPLFNCIEVAVQILPDNMQSAPTEPRIIQRLYLDSTVLKSAVQSEHGHRHINTNELQRLLVEHIISRIDLHLPATGSNDLKLLEKAFYFDDNLYPVNISPILVGPPYGLHPASVSSEHTLHWHGSVEIEQKLQQLMQAQQELHDAVTQAEKLSKMVDIPEDSNIVEEVISSTSKAMLLADHINS
jgi:hypothetical protein